MHISFQIKGTFQSLKAVLHGTICMIRFVQLLFGFKISSIKSEGIELTLSFSNRIIQILMQNIVTISQFTRSDQSNHTKTEYEYTNRIIQIVQCKTTLTHNKHMGPMSEQSLTHNSIIFLKTCNTSKFYLGINNLMLFFIQKHYLTTNIFLLLYF